MGDPYEKPEASRQHTGWRWDGEKNSWVLPNSNNSDCVCAQYVVYKMLGLVPDPDLAVEQVDLDVTAPSVLSWLTRNGFAPHPGGPRRAGAPPECGCGDGQQTACVVLYRDSRTGDPMHIAAFDPQLCDWGGKLSGHGSIVRYCDPEDYFDWIEEAERNFVDMVFYCKSEAVPYVSDEAINRGLNRIEDDESAVAEEPVPDDFGLFPTLRRFLGWLIGGLLLLLLYWLFFYR